MAKLHLLSLSPSVWTVSLSLSVCVNDVLVSSPSVWMVSLCPSSVALSKISSFCPIKGFLGTLFYPNQGSKDQGLYAVQIVKPFQANVWCYINKIDMTWLENSQNDNLPMNRIFPIYIVVRCPEIMRNLYAPLLYLKRSNTITMADSAGPIKKGQRITIGIKMWPFPSHPLPQTHTHTHTCLPMTNSLWHASVNMARKGSLPLPRADKAVESASGRDSWVSPHWIRILLPVNHFTFLAAVRKYLRWNHNSGVSVSVCL